MGDSSGSYNYVKKMRSIIFYLDLSHCYKHFIHIQVKTRSMRHINYKVLRKNNIVRDAVALLCLSPGCCRNCPHFHFIGNTMFSVHSPNYSWGNLIMFNGLCSISDPQRKRKTELLWITGGISHMHIHMQAHTHMHAHIVYVRVCM